MLAREHIVAVAVAVGAGVDAVAVEEATAAAAAAERNIEDRATCTSAVYWEHDGLAVATVGPSASLSAVGTKRTPSTWVNIQERKQDGRGHCLGHETPRPQGEERRKEERPFAGECVPCPTGWVAGNREWGQFHAHPWGEEEGRRLPTHWPRRA